MVLDKREIEKERLNGKIIMAIKIIKDQNKLAPYVHSSEVPVTVDKLARWMDISKKAAEQVDSLCYTLAPKVLVWSLIYEYNHMLISVEQARCYLIKRIKEKVLYAEENYHFPFDVIKHAMPIQLLDEEKEICEDNIENIGIINSMAYEIYEGIKVLNEKE